MDAEKNIILGNFHFFAILDFAFAFIVCRVKGVTYSKHGTCVGCFFQTSDDLYEIDFIITLEIEHIYIIDILLLFIFHRKGYGS